MTVADKEKIMANKKDEKRVDPLVTYDKIPTGSDILDIALEGGWDVGGVSNVYADSTGGKTLFAVEMIYQSLLKYTPPKVHYRYDDAEVGLKFDTKDRYGYPLVGTPHLIHEPIVENVKSDILDFCDEIDASKGEVGIYVVDSIDFLQTLDDQARTDKERKAYKKSGEAENIGTYGNRAKKIKEVLRSTLVPAHKANLHIMMISQVIANINGGMFEEKTVATGGFGAKFGSSKRYKIKRVCDLGPKDRPYGFRVCVVLDKTRTKFEGRKVFIDIMTDSGFDNVRSNLIFLYDLLDERGRELPSKGDSLKWEASYNPKHGDTEEGIPNETYKEFAEEMGITEDVKAEYKRFSVPNIKKYISENVDIMTAFADKYGVMSLDDLAVYIENNDLEEELTRRVRLKWDYLEEKDRPKNRKERKKVIL